MKFGKRLHGEAERKFGDNYLNYKALKRALDQDCNDNDASFKQFWIVMYEQLEKVNKYYSDQEKQLEIEYTVLKNSSASANDITALLTQVKELVKYQGLNYLAVIKILKKLNRKSREISKAIESVRAGDLLRGQSFCKKSELQSKVEVLQCRVAQKGVDKEQKLQSYHCPICLDLLHTPVSLACAHRFCWGCIGAHYAHTIQTQLQDDDVDDNSQRSDESDKKSAVSSHPQGSGESCEVRYYCPVCRASEVKPPEELPVDNVIMSYIEKVQKSSSNSSSSESDECSIAQQGLLPPIQEKYRGKMTVCLDLDGTLVSTYAPKKAPRVVKSLQAYIVGKGGKLNPGGVFVIERPGLREFLQEVSAFSEVIIFTAGLEDYAKPIIDAIDPDNKWISGRVYRDGTVWSSKYPCVKDLSRLGRDLNKILLVDDTPLAFLHQPDNGVPVFAFRGDPDDNLLLEAVLPLITTLASERDVRNMLNARFKMPTWFSQNGYSVDAEQGQESGEESCASSPTPLSYGTNGNCILMMEFEQTLFNWSAMERLVEELAPELLAMIVSDDGSFSKQIQIMNAVLSEMARRGVSKDRILTLLRIMGGDIPPGVKKLIRLAYKKGRDVFVFSDSNHIFVTHMLQGGKLGGYVKRICTNQSSFQRIPDVNKTLQHEGKKSVVTVSHRLVVQQQKGAKCSLCAKNDGQTCRACEIKTLRSNLGKKQVKIIFVGSQTADLCAAKELSKGDVLCIQSGSDLAKIIDQEKIKIEAEYNMWTSYDELYRMASNVIC